MKPQRMNACGDQENTIYTLCLYVVIGLFKNCSYGNMNCASKKFGFVLMHIEFPRRSLKISKAYDNKEFKKLN